MDEIIQELFAEFKTNEQLEITIPQCKYWGEGNVHVVFSVPHGKVVCRCKNRRHAAHTLWRFRKAQREVKKTWRTAANGIMRPPAHVSNYQRFSLRWLAERLPIICVRGADVGGKRKDAFTCLAPLFRHYQSLKA